MWINKKIKNIGSKGDTIIEILLSITVLSLVLSVSYGLANRNSQATRQAQEREEAQKLAEEQLELLRGTVGIDNPWEDVCFDEAGDPTSNNPECTDRGPGNLYNINITQSGDVNSGVTYTAEVTWENIRGAEVDDRLTLSYKLPVTGDIPITDNFQCNNGLDDGGDGEKDANDSDCWSIPGNPASYDPTIDDEDPPPPVRLAIIKNPAAGGTVTGGGINCGTTCVKNDIVSGTNINLSAFANTNYTFSGWNPSHCNSFVITADTTCRANFTYTPSECSDGEDNDFDSRVDADDPGCHSDYDPDNPSTYLPGHDDESSCDFRYKSLCV